MNTDDLLKGAALAIAALIVFLLFYLGAKPVAVGLFPEPWDKLAHFVTYAAIAALLCLGLPRRWQWYAALPVGIIGALDEWHQVYLPGRSADLGDLLTDIVAAIFAVTAIHLVRTHRQRAAAKLKPRANA